MQIQLEQIGKKYKNHWIFKNINYTFDTGKKYAVLGENGSGKSTLLKIIAGQTAANKGTVKYQNTDKENLHKHISYCAPYVELIEELSFNELITYLRVFKSFRTSFNEIELQEKFGFHSNKWIKEYSSGMKQRVKLIVALYLNVDVIILDEPTSNLDEEGVNWYLETLESETKDKTVIIASNIAREYSMCDEKIEIKNYK